MRQNLKYRLLKLSPESILTFGLICAERLYPNYIAFSKANNWGEPQVLREALDFAWKSLLEAKPADSASLEVLQQKCLANTPDADNFESYMSHGLDAACAAAYVLDFLETQDAQNVEYIAELCFDTVDMYLRWEYRSSYGQEIDSLEAAEKYFALEEELMRTHPLLAAETDFQKTILETVSFTHQVDQFQNLHDTWRGQTRSNLGLP